MKRSRADEGSAAASASAAEAGPRMLARFAGSGLGEILLMPGDPDRVRVMLGQWDEGELFELDRGLLAARGRYGDAGIAALSSGIGGPSLECLLVEAVALGVRTVIRVGTTGAIRQEIDCGDLVINEASVRLDGTSSSYVREAFPAAASYDVTQALVTAAVRQGYRHWVGVGATTASLYAGQDRTAVDFRSTASRGLLDELTEAGVLNFEMEAATLFVVGRLLGVRTGAICSVIAQRRTGAWADAGGIERACRTAAEAVLLLVGGGAD